LLTTRFHLIILTDANCCCCAFGVTGILGLVDYEKEVLACLKLHVKKLTSKQLVPKDLLARFREKYPEARAYL
jgi:hypothetical protein